jgi:hypothetical protein
MRFIATDLSSKHCERKPLPPCELRRHRDFHHGLLEYDKGTFRFAKLGGFDVPRGSKWIYILLTTLSSRSISRL